MTKLTYSLFIDGKPIEEYTEAEKEEFAKEAAERLGKVLDGLLSEEEFERL